MKNLIMIALALVTIAATAQERKKESRQADMTARMELRQAMTPEETAKLQTKKMTLKLDLNESQQVEVEKLFLAEAKERKEKINEFKALKDKSGDSTLSKEERLKMQNQRLDHQIAMKKKMKAILNADQYEKFELSYGKRQRMSGRKSQMKKYKD